MEYRNISAQNIEYYMNKGRSERSTQARKLVAASANQIKKIFLNHHNQDEVESDISFRNCPKTLG